jgi:hypothetical protein
VASSTAVLHALSQYSNAVLDREKLTKANYMKVAKIIQPVEKKGKCASSIARIICQANNRLDGLKLQR